MKCLLRYLLNNGAELIIPAMEFVYENGEYSYIHLFNGYSITDKYLEDRLYGVKIIKRWVDYTTLSDDKDKVKIKEQDDKKVI